MALVVRSRAALLAFICSRERFYARRLSLLPTLELKGSGSVPVWLLTACVWGQPLYGLWLCLCSPARAAASLVAGAPALASG